MENEREVNAEAATGAKNRRRRETEKAAAFLRESGANYLRGVYHRRPGWWTADDVFLGARSIEARVELERINKRYGTGNNGFLAREEGVECGDWKS